MHNLVEVFHGNLNNKFAEPYDRYKLRELLCLKDDLIYK